jgi:hypothetical protein
MSPLPRLVFLMLRMRVPSAWLEFILGDLQEGMIQRGGSSRAARRWVWSQAIRLFLRPPRDGMATGEAERRGGRDVREALADLRYAFRAVMRSRWYAATAARSSAARSATVARPRSAGGRVAEWP